MLFFSSSLFLSSDKTLPEYFLAPKFLSHPVLENSSTSSAPVSLLPPQLPGTRQCSLHPAQLISSEGIQLYSQATCCSNTGSQAHIIPVYKGTFLESFQRLMQAWWMTLHRKVVVLVSRFRSETQQSFPPKQET